MLFVFDSNLYCCYYSLGVRKGKEFMKVASRFFLIFSDKKKPNENEQHT